MMVHQSHDDPNGAMGTVTDPKWHDKRDTTWQNVSMSTKTIHYCDYESCDSSVSGELYYDGGFMTVLVRDDEYDFCSFDHCAMWAAQFGPLEVFNA